MDVQNIYRHYKGGLYQYLGIALSLQQVEENWRIVKQQAIELSPARYHENTHDVKLYLLEGGLFVNSESEVPFVVYKSLETGKRWIREVSDFHGLTKTAEGQLVKRFELSETRIAYKGQ